MLSEKLAHLKQIIDQGREAWSDSQTGPLEHPHQELAAVAKLGKWAEEHLPELLYQLDEARYKFDRIQQLCEDMEPADRAAIMEVLDA